MNVKKAVITAAGPTQRQLPLQSLVDRDGQTKTVLRIVLEEVLSAGVEKVCVVIHPGDRSTYEDAVGSLPAELEVSAWDCAGQRLL